MEEYIPSSVKPKGLYEGSPDNGKSFCTLDIDAQGDIGIKDKEPSKEKPDLKARLDGITQESRMQVDQSKLQAIQKYVRQGEQAKILTKGNGGK